MKHQQQPLTIAALLISTALFCGCAEPCMPSIGGTAVCCAYEVTCCQAPEPIEAELRNSTETTDVSVIQEAGSGLR